jgi:O-antigen/teichoic acid export membrane protein
VVLLIGIARLIDMSNGVNTEIIQNSPYYRFNLISILFLGLISFATNYLMIPRFGLVGAAAGSTISILLFNLLKGGFIWWKMRLHPFEKRTLGILLLLAAAYGLAMLVPTQGDALPAVLITMALRSLVVVGVVFAGVWRFKLSDELHALIAEHVLARLPFKKAK